ncbi:MAG: redox-regulated ATPase YchF [Chloroflexi bacterium]|nr:redox-regulated ATPase YchF [Chloroflexota bacterium]
MSLKLGIVGLPKSGKTTLFNAITGSHAETSTYSSDEQPNVAVVKVPDSRLGVLGEMFHPRKVTPADVQFTDVAGMSAAARDKDAKEPISRQTLGFISTVDALVLVVRAFENPAVPLPEATGGVDPARDVDSMMLEMAFSDLGIIERRMERIKGEIQKMKGAEREIREHEEEVLSRVGPLLEEGTHIRDMGLSEDEMKAIRNYGFLTAKPVLIVANLGEKNLDEAMEIEAQIGERWSSEEASVMAIPAQLEMEMAQLAPEEAAEFRESMGLGASRLGEVVSRSYALLGLISFLTAGEDEVRAWTIRKGSVAQRAAGTIHTDLERGFIRAETVHFDDLIAAGGMVEAKKRGTVRSEGKSYVVKDGDIINVLFTQTKTEKPT